MQMHAPPAFATHSSRGARRFFANLLSSVAGSRYGGRTEGAQLLPKNWAESFGGCGEHEWLVGECVCVWGGDNTRDVAFPPQMPARSMKQAQNVFQHVCS